jgi:hypothetical protein
MNSLLQRSSEKVIQKAFQTEDYLAKWYRKSAKRFRPYDFGISFLFEALSEEEENKKQELLTLVNQIAGVEVGKISDKNNLFISHQIAFEGSNSKHFFVVDKTMAVTILNKALESKYATQHFYKKCSLSELHPSLRMFYERLSLFEKQHAQVLEESNERFQADHELRSWRSLYGISNGL